MNFKRYIELLLPPIWRKPVWVALLLSLTRPLVALYNQTVGAYSFYKRRAACNGSVVALEHLIAQEYGIQATIQGTYAGGRMYLWPRGMGNVYIHARSNEGLYLYQRGALVADVDYIVSTPAGTRQETRARISALVAIYNSAGFTYRVE